MPDKKPSTRPAHWNSETFAKEFPSESSCLYLIEADSFAQHVLWKEWSIAAEKLVGSGGSLSGKTRIDWSGRSSGGHMITIGHIESRPIVVSFLVDEIAGIPVAFYYGCSQLVDHKMIDDFLESAMPKVSKTDAGNFHHFAHKVDELAAIVLRCNKQKELDLVAQRGAASSRRAL